MDASICDSPYLDSFKDNFFYAKHKHPSRNSRVINPKRVASQVDSSGQSKGSSHLNSLDEKYYSINDILEMDPNCDRSKDSAYLTLHREAEMADIVNRWSREEWRPKWKSLSPPSPDRVTRQTRKPREKRTRVLELSTPRSKYG
jgi:hypothetical protein